VKDETRPALLSFLLSRGTRKEGIHAIKAIRVFAKLGETIPEELLPWLDAALGAWVETQGNAVSNHETDRMWKMRVMDAHSLVLNGYTPKAAFAAIAERDGVKPATVKQHYYRGQAGIKKAVEADQKAAHFKTWLSPEMILKQEVIK
jgi:hypothetical protein